MSFGRVLELDFESRTFEEVGPAGWLAWAENWGYEVSLTNVQGELALLSSRAGTKHPNDARLWEVLSPDCETDCKNVTAVCNHMKALGLYEDILVDIYYGE